MALTQGSRRYQLHTHTSTCITLVASSPFCDADVSCPSREQRGGVERQLETQGHHAQSALGLLQVRGETTNRKLQGGSSDH